MVFFIHAFSLPKVEIVLERGELIILIALNVLLFAGGQVSFLMGISKKSMILQILGLTLSILGAMLFYLFFKSPKAHAEFFLFPINILGLAIIGIPYISFKGFKGLTKVASKSKYISVDRDENIESVYEIRYIFLAIICLVALVLVYIFMDSSAKKMIIMIVLLVIIALLIFTFIFKGCYDRPITKSQKG